jgi:hypothetical protein
MTACGRRRGNGVAHNRTEWHQNIYQIAHLGCNLRKRGQRGTSTEYDRGV